MKNTISVVIPAYNMGGSIARALRSVIEQTVSPLEIIVVDDGSTDNTAGMVRSVAYGSNVPVFLLQQANAGAAAARQLGSQKALGTHIAYLDADDFWPTHKIGMLIDILNRREVDFLFGDIDRRFNSNRASETLSSNRDYFPWVTSHFMTGYRIHPDYPLMPLRSKTLTDILLKGFPAFPSTYLIKKEALEQVGGWNAKFRRCQDFDLALRLSRYAIHLFYMDAVTATMGIDDHNGDTSAYVIKQTRGDVEVLKHHHSNAVGGYREALALAIARRLCSLGHAFRAAGDYASSAKAYRDALDWPGKRWHAFSRYLFSALCS